MRTVHTHTVSRHVVVVATRGGVRPTDAVCMRWLRRGSLLGWRRGVVVSGVRRMNEVNARRARLVPGWVTVLGRVYHLCSVL